MNLRSFLPSQVAEVLDVRVQEADFDIGVETGKLLERTKGAGAVGSFLGVVRGGDGLAALTLEHYPGMTEASIERICLDAIARFSLLGCTVIHRVGSMRINDQIVLVLAAAAHRAEALDATSYLIDWLKTSAPFWKREDFEDGRSNWVAARESDDLATDRWR